LRDRICLLEYAPGSRLGEVELANEFGTSRTPIRRVLGRLEAEGLVERRHGVGTIITDVDPASLEQVYRLRFELASLMGRLAPMNCGDRELAFLGHHLSRCEDLARRPEPVEFARLNMDFNVGLFSMIGNAPLREITERLYFQTTRIWIKSIPALDIADEIRVFGRQIFDVIEALKVDDHGAVGDICRAHISMSFERMRRHMSTGHGSSLLGTGPGV
jgi:DNA-binding GntR family transcriptional regulator